MDVPTPVAACIQFLKRNRAHLCEGIFRLVGNHQREEELAALFNENEDIIFCDTYDVHSVSSVLKKYLRDLPEPPIPESMLDEFCRVLEIRNEEGFEAACIHMKKMFHSLPCASNQRLIIVVASYLHFVSKFGRENLVY